MNPSAVPSTPQGESAEDVNLDTPSATTPSPTAPHVSGQQITLAAAKSDVLTLSTTMGMDIDSIKADRNRGPEYFMSELLASQEGPDGVLQAATLAIQPEGIGTVRLEFKGNNLENSCSEDSVFEFTFSAASITTLGQAKAIRAQLAELIQQQQLQVLSEGTSISANPLVVSLLEHIDSNELPVTAFHIENARMTNDSPVASLLAEASLGGISALELAYDPERVLDRPAIKNAIIENITVAAVVGQVTNSRLSQLDVRGGHIDLYTDEASIVERISAIGVTMSGSINCYVSGDFRRSILGAKSQPLGGKTFQVSDGQLATSKNIDNFLICSRHTGDETHRPFMVINEEEVLLEEFGDHHRVEIKSISELLELQNRSRFNIKPTLDSQAALNDMLGRFVKFEAMNRMRLARESLQVDLDFSEPGPENNSSFLVSAQIQIPGEPVVQLNLLPAFPERILYSLRQIHSFPEQRDLLKYHDYNVANRWTSTGSAPAPAATPGASRGDEGLRFAVSNAHAAVLSGRRREDETASGVET